MSEAGSYWQQLIAIRDEQRENRKNASQVIKLRDLPVEDTPMGRLRWYLHPNIKNTVVRSHIFYRQDIPPLGSSGSVKQQGGQIVFILNGKGRTSIDGFDHRWVEGDVLNLPLKRDGIIVQHFNDSDVDDAVLLVTEVNLIDCLGVDRGSGFELLEPASAGPKAGKA